MHSGVRCLHLLCHHLNRLGYEAYTTGTNAPDTFLTRHADERAIRATREAGIKDIVIYPEVVAGNPLSGDNVVRYLLNRPSFLRDVGMEDYGRHDFFLHFADEFRPPGVSSRRLSIPLLDRSVFHKVRPEPQRHGYLVYSVRHRPNLRRLPKWVAPLVVISRKNPRDPQTLAELYRRSRALIVWEATAAIGEAMHCGCPVIMIPHDGFDHAPIVRKCLGCGLVLGWDESRIERARRTVPVATTLYRLRSLGLDRSIHGFVRQASRYFAARRGHPVELPDFNGL